MHLSATIGTRLIDPVRKELEVAREEMLRGIANADAGRQILSECIRPDAFTPVGAPNVVARIYRGPDGLYLGHATGSDGKIVGNARWMKISGLGSRLLTSAGMLSGHLMLVEISAKIDQVQKDVAAIRAALDDDRMESLRAAIQGVEDALEAHSPENKHALMTATIPHLQKAIYQEIATLKREIADVPSPKEWAISRVITNREPDMRLRLERAEKTFRACLEGISILSQAYFAIDERELGCKSAVQLLTRLRAAGINGAEHRARLLTPQGSEDRPERIWAEFLRALPEIVNMLDSERRRGITDTAEVDIELLPAEIKVALDNQPTAVAST
jgi:hypothetical protein